MDETTKAMIKDMIKRGADNATIMGVTGATQEQIDQVASEGKSSFLNNLGIFSTAQASEIDPNNPPSMLPTGAMDTETPFGDKLRPEVPRGGGIFSLRQFDQIRGGPESGAFGVRGLPQVQNMPVDLEELAALEDDIIEQQLAEASRGEGESFLDRLRDIGGNVLDFIGGGGVIGRGITGLTNMLGDAFKGSRFYNPISPVSGQRIFAPESRAGNPFGLQMRRDAASISRMLRRQAQGKRIGENRLKDIMGKFGLSDVDTDAMSDSIAESAQTGYGGFGSAEAAAEAASRGGRDYSQSPGAMAGDMEYGEE